MCDLMAALAIGGTILSAAGQYQQGKAQAEAARFNSKVADMNAKISERRARDALERGKLDEQRKRTEVARFKGRQMAAIGASGADVSFGSPLDTLVDTAVLGELDALTIRSNAAREAYDYRVDAANRRSSATLNRYSADAAETGGMLAAGSTLLTGGSKAMGDYRSRAIGMIA
jgi:hypothetical protein